MDKRKRALAILNQARELLANRLIENLIEAGDSILDDAEGSSYMDEIETLHQKVGARLSKINIMFTNLSQSAPEDSDSEASDSEASDSESNDSETSDSEASASEASTPGDAQPGTVAEEIPLLAAGPEQTNAPKPINFALFGRQIADNDMDGAGRTMATLLDVDQKLGLHCATSFRDRLQEDSTTLQKAISLRAKLLAGEHVESLTILWDCFRLQGAPAVLALETLRTRLTAA
jgi:hypothetical protein